MYKHPPPSRNGNTWVWENGLGEILSHIKGLSGQHQVKRGCAAVCSVRGCAWWLRRLLEARNNVLYSHLTQSHDMVQYDQQSHVIQHSSTSAKKPFQSGVSTKVFLSLPKMMIMSCVIYYIMSTW